MPVIGKFVSFIDMNIYKINLEEKTKETMVRKKIFSYINKNKIFYWYYQLLSVDRVLSG
jgi:hypothetical protein